jgi:peptidoglycan/xylan/chitin deacetylase (PgdA/CDA1 family)
VRDEKWRRDGFEPLVSAAGGAVCGIELWSVKRLNLSLWATCAGKLTVAEMVAASCERHEREDWASGGACQSLRIYARAAQPGRMEVRKRMDRLLNFRRRCHASLLVLFASIPQNYLQLASQDTALAAEVEQSTTPISESEHRSPCSDKRSTVKVPILVYHHIRTSIPVGSRVERRLTVTVEIFDNQMKYLHENGYQVITFADLVNCLKKGGELPPKPVIISFDDGWEDQFVYALPRLEEYHYIATFFVVTNFVGSRGFVSWSKLRTIVAEGMEIGSHSRSHPYLDKIENPRTLWDQIYTSKQILESQLGVAVDEFAYPYGSYNEAIASTVRLAGYKTARACCVDGVQSDAYALRAVMAPNELGKFERYLGARSAPGRN